MIDAATAQQDVEPLLQLSDDQQLLLLANRVMQLQGAPAADLAGPPDALVKFAKTWLGSFVKQIHSRICDDKGDWHDDVQNAVKNGAPVLAATLATLAVTSLAVAPPIAAAIGAIIASQYFKGIIAAGGQATIVALCQALTDNLPQE